MRWFRPDPARLRGRRHGRLRFGRLVGEGSFGLVYEARPVRWPGAPPRLAVKVLKTREGTRSLEREWKLGDFVRHRNVARVYLRGRYRGWPLVVMEYVDGLSLEGLVARTWGVGRALPPDVALRLGAQICAGLAAIHGARDAEGRPLGLVHRDLKPSNIMVERRGVVKILDLGVAWALDPPWTRTRTGGFVGTLHYASPEQVRRDGTLTAASDLFALGAILYLLLTGEVLFAASSEAGVVYRIVHEPLDEELAAVESAVPGMGAILAGLLRRDPAARSSDAAQVGAALTGLLEDGEPLADRLAGWMPVSQETRASSATVTRRRAFRWGMPAAGAVLAGGLGLLHWLGPGSPTGPGEPSRGAGENAAPGSVTENAAVEPAAPGTGDVAEERPAGEDPALNASPPGAPAVAPSEGAPPPPRPDPSASSSSAPDVSAVGPGTVSLSLDADYRLNGVDLGGRLGLDEQPLQGGINTLRITCLEGLRPRTRTLRISGDEGPIHLGRCRCSALEDCGTGIPGVGSGSTLGAGEAEGDRPIPESKEGG